MSRSAGPDSPSPAGSLRWRLRKARFRLRVRLGRSTPRQGLPPATVVLLSYKRPWNMDTIARAVLRCGFVERAVISNNNPEVSIRDWVKVRDERLHLVDQPQRQRCAIRLQLAYDTDAAHYIFVDDDVFLLPSQLDRLYRLYLEDTDVPHGIVGMVRVHGEPDRRFQLLTKAVEQEVDVINRVYLLSRAHVEQSVRILDELKPSTGEELMFGDDMVMSFSGSQRPRCHDIGPILDCPTSDTPGIAVWREPEFIAKRASLYQHILSLRPRS